MLLVITSCISPPLQENLKLHDSSIRFNYTVAGLKKILDCHIFDSFIICDSSNYDFSSTPLEELLHSYKVKYELLHFKGDFKITQEKGKGYGEGEIMKYIFDNSSLLYSEESFYKITGRLYVDNLKEVVRNIHEETNYFNIVALKFLQALDSRFYKIKIEDFKKSLLNSCNYVDDNRGKWYEVVFRDLLKQNGVPFCQFPVLPIIRGVSGTHGIDTFEKDLTFYVHLITTKLNIHNSLFSAIVLYLSVKIQQTIKYLKYARK